MTESTKMERPVILRRKQAPSWSQAVSADAWWRIAIIAGLFLLAYWGEFRRLAWIGGDWTKPDWTHGYLIPLMSLYVVHINRERLWRIPIRPSLLGLPLMLFAMAMYLAGVYLQIGYPRTFSFLIMTAGAVMLMGGWRLALAVWFPIVLLIFAIPLPSVWYTTTTFPLRQAVSILSTGFLNLLPGIDAIRQATVIEYTYTTATAVTRGDLSVEEACSGMRLLMAFLAMGAIMAYLMREKPVWHRLTLLALCVPIAIFCNFVRVTTTGLLQVYGYPNLAKGGAHEALGLVMMVLALGLFCAVNWMLSAMVTDGDDETPEQQAIGGDA